MKLPTSNIRMNWKYWKYLKYCKYLHIVNIVNILDILNIVNIKLSSNIVSFHQDHPVQHIF